MLPTQLTVGHLSWTFQVWNQLCLRSDSFHGRYANWTNIYVSCYVNLCHVYMCIHIQFPWLSWFTGGPRKYWSTVCQVHKHVSAVFDLASKWSSATTCSNLEEYRKINRSSQVHGQLYPASTIPCEHRDRSRNLRQFTTSAVQAHLRALYPAVSGIPQ